MDPLEQIREEVGNYGKNNSCLFTLNTYKMIQNLISRQLGYVLDYLGKEQGGKGEIRFHKEIDSIRLNKVLPSPIFILKGEVRHKMASLA